jgi:CheY-like chemotaxis protein
VTPRVFARTEDMTAVHPAGFTRSAQRLPPRPADGEVRRDGGALVPPLEVAVQKILVVDDDPSVRQLVCDVLELEGYDVAAVADGYAALESVAADRPDCMILDVMMPGLSGHDVLARVRQADGGPFLPVVMLTAAADDAQAWQAWTGGVDYFLEKPFDAAQLLRFLTYLFAELAQR